MIYEERKSIWDIGGRELLKLKISRLQEIVLGGGEKGEKIRTKKSIPKPER